MSVRDLVSVADYIARYGDPDDDAQVLALLEDAADMLESEYENFHGVPYAPDASERFDRCASAVCCAMVHRAVDTPDIYAGAQQFSRTAGPFSVSITPSNPAGDLYVGKSDLSRLGLVDNGGLWSIPPMVGGDHAKAVSR